MVTIHALQDVETQIKAKAVEEIISVEIDQKRHKFCKVKRDTNFVK